MGKKLIGDVFVGDDLIYKGFFTKVKCRRHLGLISIFHSVVPRKNSSFPSDLAILLAIATILK